MRDSLTQVTQLNIKKQKVCNMFQQCGPGKLERLPNIPGLGTLNNYTHLTCLDSHSLPLPQSSTSPCLGHLSCQVSSCLQFIALKFQATCLTILYHG